MTASCTKAMASLIVLKGCAFATSIETRPGPEIFSVDGHVMGSGSHPVEESTHASTKGPPSTCKHSGGHGGVHWADRRAGAPASPTSKAAKPLAVLEHWRMSKRRISRESMSD